MTNNISKYGLAAIAVTLLTQPVSNAYADDTQVFKDNLVKAGYIYNFVKFVEWPGDKSPANLSNLDICVMGDSPISTTSVVFKSASTPKLKLSLVEEPSASNAIKHCHILVIGNSEDEKLPQILAALRTQPVLTVSEISNFVDAGGMIELLTVDGSVKFLVNLKPVSAAGMRIDAQLLEIAKKVINK